MKKNYFRYIFWGGFVIWFVGSWIGGWGRVAETTLEGYTDTIGGIFMLYGGFGDILKGLKIFKNYEGDTINPKKLNYIDRRPDGKIVVNTAPPKEVK